MNDEYKLLKKYYNKNDLVSDSHKVKSNFIINYINKILLVSVITLIILSVAKCNSSFKDTFIKNVFNNNISFSFINKEYEKYFGKVIPVSKVMPVTEEVFNETLIYKNKEEYKDGVKLDVGSKYLMPVLESGIVVYKGTKDNYGEVIIVQQIDGIDLWYVGINSNIKLYDYVTKGSYLGESIDSNICLYYQKNGDFLDYKEYFKY